MFSAPVKSGCDLGDSDGTESKPGRGCKVALCAKAAAECQGRSSVAAMVVATILHYIVRLVLRGHERNQKRRQS